MKLQQQPNKWSCLPTAFAMVIDMPVEKLINLIGQDGSEKIFPGLREPYCYRSFEPQEIIDVLLIFNFGVIEILKHVVVEAENKRLNLPINNKKLFHGNRMHYYLLNYTGVLIGTRTDIPHAVAWDGHCVLDPDHPKTYSVDNFNIDMFLIITKINITK